MQKADLVTLGEVRAIEPDELSAWLAVSYGALLLRGSPDDEALRLRPTLDLSRCYASLEDGRIVGTFRSFPTELTLPGGAVVRACAESNAGVLGSHRRRGHLRALQLQDLRDARLRGEAVAVTIAHHYALYARWGLGPATEHATYVVDATRANFARAADRRVELVDRRTLRRVAPQIYEHYRATTAGALRRSANHWDQLIPDGPSPGTFAVVSYSEGGEAEGYLRYRVERGPESRLPSAVLTVDELLTTTPNAYARLWRYACELDPVTEVRARDRSVHELLPWLLADARACRQTERTDFLWVRVLDVPGVLAARRYARADELVFRIADAHGFSDGTYRVSSEPDGTKCAATTADYDLALTIESISALLLGGTTLRTLAAAGWVEARSDEVLARADAFFRTEAVPWCNTWF